MPQYAYAVIIVDGKRKVIKTKGVSDANPLLANAKVMLAKSELEKDLKAAGIKYTYIGISEHPPTAAELEKVSKAAAAKTPVPKPTKKPIADPKSSFTFKAARGNEKRGPCILTLKEAIEFAKRWSEDVEWDYEYNVDFMTIFVYRDGVYIGYVDDEDGEWHSRKKTGH